MKKFILPLLLIYSTLTYTQPKLTGTLQFHGSKEGGAVFRFDLPGTSPGIISAFDNQSPHNPSGGVCAGDGNWLYGLTDGGGNNNFGALYRVQRDGTQFTKLYDITSPVGNRALPYYHTDAIVYFTDDNVIGKYNTATGTTTTIPASASIATRNLYVDANDWIYFTELAFPNRLVKMKTDGSSWTVLHGFTAATEGEQGSVGVTEIPGDTLFGANMYGGSENGGTLYSIKKDGSGFVVHHQFTSATGTLPTSKLMYFDGKLYGSTLLGGDFNQGVIFCINSDGSNYRVIRHLGMGDGTWTEASFGNLSVSSNGRIIAGFRNYLYSVDSANYYRLFRMDTSGNDFHPFFLGNSQRDNGQGQLDVLLMNDETLFFPTNTLGRNDGGVLNISDTLGNGNNLYHFGYSTNGFRPTAVIKASNGKLYGSNIIGGTAGNGVIFSMNTDGTGFTKLHEFTDAEGYEPSGKLLEASDGKLYGACRNGGPNGFGILFRINKDGTGFQVIYDYANFTGGYSPVGSLIEDAAGTLYGTNFWGSGSIFKINKNGTGYTELKVFTATPDFSNPYNGLTLKGNYLYGAAGYGGAVNKGGIFRIKKDGSGYQVLHEFNGADGELPVGSPFIASNGKLYGTTANGGLNSVGTIYSIDSTGTNFLTLRNLSSADGTSPWTGLIQASDGLLYGGTQLDGSGFGGTLYRINLNGTGFTVLKNFASNEGQGVLSIIDLNGNFSVLPVRFLSFTAQGSDEKVLLNWKTTNERNTDHFDIQRSVDGTSFTTIGNVHASGNSNLVIPYAFDDAKPMHGLNYYRLKEIDLDGSVSYSQIVSVRFDKNVMVLIIPNPVKDVLNVQLITSEFTTASVFDASGKLVAKQNIRSANVQVNTSKLPKGWYLLKLEGKTNRQYPFVKE